MEIMLATAGGVGRRGLADCRHGTGAGSIRRACGRAREVVVIGYQPRSFAPWWEKNAAALARCGNLRVLEVDCADSLGSMCQRSMQLQCLVQDGEVQLIGPHASVVCTPRMRQGG